MYPEAYIQYLVQFHAHRDFFECHEILEEHWKKKDRFHRERHWVGFIQLAVGLYHHRRENWRGAWKILQSAFQIIVEHHDHFLRLGIDSDRLLDRIDNRLSDIQHHKKYTDMNLPITDESLIEICKKRCAEQQVKWLADSDLTDKYNVHRHIWRKRPTDKDHFNKKIAKERKKLSRF